MIALTKILCIIKIIVEFLRGNEMKLNKYVRALSNKKAALGIVTTVIGMSSIILTSGQAHASTVSTNTHTVTKTPKTNTSTNKTTLKSVSTTTVKAKSIQPTITTKSTAKAKAITTKAPTTSKTVPAKSTSAVKKSTTTPAKPTTTPKKSTTSVKQPTTTKPTTTVKKPSTTSKKPTTSVKKPSTTTAKLTTTVKKPSTTAKKPTASVKKPSTTAKKPTTLVKQPSTTTTKPTTTVKEPSTTTAKSTASIVPTEPREPTKSSEVQKGTEPTNEASTHAQQPITVPAITNPALDMPVETGKPDYYKSMTDLYNDTKEGTDWKKDTRNSGSRVLIVAPHGGNIEQGTSELTKLVADDGNYDYFSFEAIRPSNNTQLHVTSTHYDDETLHEMIEDRTATISIHGAQGDEPIVYLGGPKSPLRDAIQSQLESKGFVVKVPPEYLGGANSNNFINKVDGSTGVQLELTTALRKAFFKDGNSSTAARKNTDNWTTTMYDFAAALNDAIKSVYPV